MEGVTVRPGPYLAMRMKSDIAYLAANGRWPVDRKEVLRRAGPVLRADPDLQHRDRRPTRDDQRRNACSIFASAAGAGSGREVPVACRIQDRRTAWFWRHGEGLSAGVHDGAADRCRHVSTARPPPIAKRLRRRWRASSESTRAAGRKRRGGGARRRHRRVLYRQHGADHPRRMAFAWHARHQCRTLRDRSGMPGAVRCENPAGRGRAAAARLCGSPIVSGARSGRARWLTSRAPKPRCSGCRRDRRAG